MIPGVTCVISDSLYYKGTNLKVVPCTSHSYENGFCKYCNEECPHTTVENNQCTICGLAMVATVTADGETAYYSALQTALNAAADGAEVKLLADVSDAATISSPVTLDLCGNSINAELTVTSVGAKLTDSVGGGVISTLTVADSMTVADLLEDGFSFRKDQWVKDLTVHTLKKARIAEIPIRLGEMNGPYDVVYKAGNKNVIALEVFAAKSGTGFETRDVYVTLSIKDENGRPVTTVFESTMNLDPDNKRAVFYLDKHLTDRDVGTYFCTVTKVTYRESDPANTYELTDGPSFIVNVQQSGTEATVETGNDEGWGTKTDTFTYGQTITVRANFDPTGEQPVSTLSMTAPAEDQCAVFDKNGTQIAEAVDVERSSAWFEIPTQVLGVGTHKLTARYVGSKNMAGTSVSFTVTVKPCEITELALDETQLAYTGAAQTKGVAAVTAGRLTLAASDYDVSGNVQTAVGSYKLTVTGKGNYTGTLTGEYTIAKAAAPEAEHGTMTVSNNHAATYEMEIPALPALDAGTYGAVSYALGEVDLSQGYYDKETGAKVADGKLFLPINANPVETTGSIGTVTIKVTTDNYEDFFLTIDVSATNKIVPIGEPTLSTTTITYGDKLSKVTLSGGLKDGDSAVPGVFSWEEPDAVLTAGEHQVTWRFVPTDGRTYAETTGTVTITVNKAAPTGAPKYTAITASGKTLEDAGLTAEGGTFSVPGTVQWVDADGNEMDVSTEVKANTAYSWKFVPEDEENYESLTGSITLYSVSSGGGGGGSSSSSSGSAAKTDDVTTTVKTDENGNTQTDVKVSDKALSDAKKSGEAVKIPTGVKAGEDSNSAPVVKIDLPKNAGETKIEVPVDNVTPGTVAVIVHEDGTEEILSSSKPTEDGLEFTIDGSATIKVIDNSKTFVDTGDHWAKGAIDYISARDLVSGVGDKLFAPDLTATRAQLWTILARMNGETVTGGQTWYELPQLWAKKNGVSDGTDPNGTITRAQLVTMLWRTAGSPTAGSETKFTDVPADSYYAQAVAWAAANGITTGVGSGRFDPEAPCTRAQLATFLYQNMK